MSINSNSEETTITFIDPVEDADGGIPESDGTADTGSDDNNDQPTAEEIDEAKKHGWKPREEHTGNPNNWVDAREYLSRGSPKRLREELDATRREFETFRRESLSVIKDIREQAERTARERYEKQFAELVAEKRKGFESGDFDAMENADKRIRELEVNRQMRQPRQELDVETQSALSEFRNQNAGWYGVDADTTAEADAFAQGLAVQLLNGKASRGEQPVLTLDEYKGILGRTAKRFAPQSAVPRNPPPVVAPGRGAPVAAKEGGFEKLSKQDQDLFYEWRKRGVFTGDIEKAKATYAKDVLGETRRATFTR